MKKYALYVSYLRWWWWLYSDQNRGLKKGACTTLTMTTNSPESVLELIFYIKGLIWLGILNFVIYPFKAKVMSIEPTANIKPIFPLSKKI